MNRVESLKLEYVDLMPKVLDQGVLYVSRKYKTATHLCCCGCDNKVVTPLKSGGWEITSKRGAVTLNPSIGSWSLACQSHYWIRGGKVVWAPKWSQSEIEAGRINDAYALQQRVTRPRESRLGKALRFVRDLFA